MINYDAYANTYDTRYKTGMCLKENEAISALLDKYNVKERKTLDVGCGTGFALDLCDIRKYKGIDLSKNMVEQARRKYPRKNFVVADFSIASLGLELFDCALCLFSIPYIGENAAEKILRHLHTGGVCICVYYNKPYLNPNSVYYGNKEEYDKNIKPLVKSSIRAFRRHFGVVEERYLTSNGAYKVSVFRKGKEI